MAGRMSALVQLSQEGKKVFHIKELGALWGIKNPNTLRITLNRYVHSGLLHSIYRGFYGLLPLEKMNPVDLGIKALHRFSYLSTESVLYETAWISQAPSAITLVSELSRNFNVGKQHYRSRQLSDRYLYQTEGLLEVDGCLKASPERALVELLYFNPKATIDKTVDWKKISELQKKWGYPLTPERYETA